MTSRDVSPALRKASALRALCLQLPHRPTRIESERLRSFEALVAEPDRVTEADVEVLLVGWRQWWREGDVDALWRMGTKVPLRVIERDRWLSTWWLAAKVVRVQTTEGGNASARPENELS